MSAKLFFNIIRARFWLVLLVVVATVAATAYVTVNEPPQYTTFTSVVLDLGEAGPFDQGSIPRQYTAGYLLTQPEIVRSRSTASKVVNGIDLSLLERIAEEYLAEHNQTRLDSPEVRQRLMDRLLANLDVNVARESRVINIRFTSSDPVLSAAIADAFAQAYMEVVLELNIEPARRNAEWFDEQLKTLRARLEEKQRAVTAYQAEKGIISIDERLDTERLRFDELTSELADAQSDVDDARARQLGDRHPDYLRAVERERTVSQRLARQRARVFEFQQLRDELDLLIRDVENARLTYDLALQEFYRNSMESQFNQTNVSVLSEAPVRAAPSGPNLPVNVALAAALGLAFGIGLALLAEILWRRVRIQEDISERIGVPVLAVL